MYRNEIVFTGDFYQVLVYDGFIELGHAVKIGSRDPNQKKNNRVDRQNMTKGQHPQERLQTQRRLVNLM